MTYDFLSNDFDPAIYEAAKKYIQQCGGRIIRGVWSDVKVWENKAHELIGINPIWNLVEQPNGITDEGIHHVEDRFTDIDAPTLTLAPWHAGLINASGFTGVDSSDTMASHSGWVESTDYSESVRQLLGFGSAALRKISDSVSFSINTTVTIQGLLISSDNVKGGTTGTLFSTALFGTPPSLVTGNVLTANYTLSD